MDLIDEAKDFYKNSWLLLIVNITYKYIDYFLCLLYLIWYPFNIIFNEELKTFANENYINYYLILYGFYKMHSFVKQKKNIYQDITMSIILLIFYILDIINNNTIHTIQYWILYNLLFSVFIFVYGTMYLIVKLDFDKYNYSNEDYIEFTAEICSETV